MSQEDRSPVLQVERKNLCQEMIKMLRAQQRGELIIEEFAHFTNEELESIVQYLLREIREIEEPVKSERGWPKLEGEPH
ncbi:hypothetical protein ES703_16782 [subsurface metagenome]